LRNRWEIAHPGPWPQPKRRLPTEAAEFAEKTGSIFSLEALPSAVCATHEEVKRLIEDRKLWGLGIGWIDAHLLASALLSNYQFWTLDGRLDRAAAAAGVKLYHRA